ncbi:MAG: hypothetical protein IJE43_13585 [Alphaproteobacteria bacterium]|nr:hypothetical protein [Alphaproteobacteria bacterium]
MKKASNFKSKNILTLKDIKKIRERTDYNMSLEDAYEIVAGWKEISARDPKVRDFIYSRAVNMVKSDDPDFAQEMLNERKANGNKKLATYISLASAYDIVGGYRDADSETYYRALEIVKLDSPEFAETMSKMKESGTSFKAMTINDVKDFSERLEKNIDVALEVYNKDTIEEITEIVINDEEVSEAFKNTPFVNDEGVELVEDERKEAERIVVHTATLEEVQNVVEATDDDDLSKETIIENVKNRTLFNLGALRIGALRPKTKEFIQAIKDKSESFFANATNKLRNAFNFKKEVKVNKASVTEKFDKAKNNFSSYLDKLKKKVSISKIKAKLNKFGAAALTSLMLITSCGPFNNKQNSDPVNEAKVTTVVDTTSTIDTTASEDISIYKLETSDIQEVKEIKVPTEWNENMGISKKRWKTLTSNYFLDKKGNDNFAKLYQSISDEMLGQGGIFEGKTREEVLSFYGAIRAHNLIPHRDAIEVLNDFFKNCDGNNSIPTESYKTIWSAMKQFTPNGSVIDMEMNGKQWVESMVIDCGENPKLNIKTPAKQAPVVDTKEVADTVVTDKKDTIDVVFETVLHNSKKVIINDNPQTVNVDLFRGNNTNPNEGEFVESSSVDAVLSEKDNKDRNVILEQTSYKSSVSDTTNVANTEVADSLATPTSKVTTSETTIILSEEVTSSVDASQNVSEVADTLHNYTSQYIEVIDGMEYDVDIVADSDSLAIGTPAADNVPERGGYENSGLTESQYNRAVNYFKKDGNEMFYTLVEGVKSHPELRTKGGIAEGLSAEETVYLLMVADTWGGRGQFKDEVADFTNYIKGCSQSLELSEDIKEIFNRGNINASMDGIVGKSSNRALYMEVGDCGDNPTQTFEENDKKVAPSHPVSEKFPEFYKIRNAREFAIVFEEEVHEAKIITTTREEVQETDIDLMRGNDFDVAEGKLVRENVPVSEVRDLKANKDRKVVVSTSKTYSNDEVMTRRERRKAERDAARSFMNNQSNIGTQR